MSKPNFDPDIVSFDKLPRQLRRELRACQAKVSAAAILRLLEAKSSVADLILIIREVDRRMCEKHRAEIAKQFS